MTSIRTQRRGPMSAGPLFTLNPVYAGCLTALAFSTNVMAQQAQSVTVTGIRAAIESAISVKKNASSIVESISAEDIGKMPDATVAESISRLPGVTLQRDATGRGKNVSVRGMSADFNGATLNGREMASTGDSRGVEFDQFPAELLGSITIHKTPTAALVGQGLAATIDMRTIKPLDFRKRTLAANVRTVRTGVSSGAVEGDGDRQSFSYIDQFADRTIGVAFGFAKSNETGAALSNGGGNAWGRWERSLLDGAAKVIAPAGFGEDVIQNTLKREGAMAMFQFKPNKDFETTLDVFKSKGSFASKKTGIEGAISCQVTGNDADTCNNFPYDPLTSIVAGAPKTVTTVGGKVYLEAGTVNGVKGVVRNHLEAGADKLDAWGWNTKFKALGWDLSTDLAQSKVKRESDRFETTAGVPGRSAVGNVGTASWIGFKPGSPVFESALTLAGVDYASRSAVKLTDVNGWSGGETFPQAGYNAHPTVTDKINTGRLSGRKDFSLGLLVGAEAGLNFTERNKVRIAPEGVLRILPGTDPYGAATVPGTATTLLPTLGISVVSFDPRGTVGTIFQRVDKIDKDILNKDWSVTEKVTTGYLRGDIDGKLLGLPVSGNLGLQLVHTNQSSSGFNVDGAKCNDAVSCAAGGVYVISSAGASYVDANPSLNLNFDLGADQALRLGLAKVMARPNMNDMRSSLTYTIGNTGVVGSAGNPKLEPFRALSVDVSYEKYFGNKGYISAAGFYKKLDSYILNSIIGNYDFSRFLAPGSTVNPIGILTMPANGSGGNISGIELSVNVPFNLLTPALNGFGIMASTAINDSSVRLPVSGFKVADLDGINIPMPGLSKSVTNVRVYYENHGMQVSLGARTRADFLGEISNFQDERSLSFIRGSTEVDLQLGYEFQSGYLKGLGVLFQGTNLTNAVFERYRDVPANSLGKIKYGKSYLFGLSYKY